MMIESPRAGETHIAIGANVPQATLGGVQVPLQVGFQLIAGWEARLAGVTAEGLLAGVTPPMDLQIPMDTRPIAAELAHQSLWPSPAIAIRTWSWTFRRHGRLACAKSKRRHYC